MATLLGAEHADQPRRTRGARSRLSIRRSTISRCPAGWRRRAATALAYLNKLATTQAQMISYLDDFKLMAFVTLLAFRCFCLLRGKRQTRRRRRQLRRLRRPRRASPRRRRPNSGPGFRDDGFRIAENRKGAVWTSQPTPPYQPCSCGSTPFGAPPHRLGLNLSASALKSQAPSDRGLGRPIERFGRRSWSIGSPGTSRASLRHVA